MTTKPLSGIKVLDMTKVLAGPYCGMMLRNLGAEVIHCEMPGSGDDARAYGPGRKDPDRCHPFPSV